jgi:hypothetical protein
MYLSKVVIASKICSKQVLIITECFGSHMKIFDGVVRNIGSELDVRKVFIMPTGLSVHACAGQGFVLALGKALYRCDAWSIKA